MCKYCEIRDTGAGGIRFGNDGSIMAIREDEMLAVSIQGNLGVFPISHCFNCGRKIDDLEAHTADAV